MSRHTPPAEPARGKARSSRGRAIRRPSGPKAAATPPDDRPAPPPPTRGIPQTLGTLLGLASAFVILFGFQALQSIVAPSILAVILVITFYPVRTWLTAHRCPGWLATGVTLLALFAVILAITGSLVLALAQLINTLPSYSSEFITVYNDLIDLLAKAGISEEQITTALRNIDPQSLFGYAQTFLSGIQGIGSLLAVLLITMFFIAVDAADMPARLVGVHESRPDVYVALQSFAFRVRRYWVVSTIFGVICALLDAAALYWLGVPMAVTFGVLAFVTNYIPNIGFVIGLVPPALMALLDENATTAMWVIVAYCAINFVIQTLIQPRFTGDAVGLTPTMTFLSLLFWSWELGPLGALLAVPLTLFVKAMFIDRDPQARWLNAFISDTGK